MRLYRGGSRNGRFFTLSPSVAKRYGKVWTFETRRKLRLFKLTHSSLMNKVFPHVPESTRIALSVIFGTGTKLKKQIKILTGKTPEVKSALKGQRVSFTDVDIIAYDALYRNFLAKRGYDGAISNIKKSVAHGGLFHGEVYLHSPSAVLTRSLQELFVQYTRNTTRLVKPYRDFIQFLGGGMAIKLYLEARGIQAVETTDFDFKFAVPSPLKTQEEIDTKSKKMFEIIYSHLKSFVRTVPGSVLTWRELTGVPLDKPGLSGQKDEKKVYRVFTFLLNGKEFADASLVVYPGITRDTHLSRKWTLYFGMPIEKLRYMWSDTLYLLAGSFTKKSIMLRNPINGDKKEKGIKNAIRVGHLSFLAPKGDKVIKLARQLVLDIAIRNKKRATETSRKIITQFH